MSAVVSTLILSGNESHGSRVPLSFGAVIPSVSRLFQDLSDFRGMGGVSTLSRDLHHGVARGQVFDVPLVLYIQDVDSRLG